MKTLLNKSDFTRFNTCPTAALYGWQQQPSKNDDDPFLAYLAAEGVTVGRIARRLFTGGQLIGDYRPDLAARKTCELIEQGDVTLFEGCIVDGDFLARPDILIRQGKRLFLVEVKSKVGDLSAHQDGRMLFNIYGDIRAAWREYVYDLAFQYEVVTSAFPGLEVIPYLLLPEGALTAQSEEVSAARTAEEETPVLDDAVVKLRRQRSVLRFFPAKVAVNHVRVEVSEKMASMAQLWRSGERPVSPLRYQCRNCEYRLKDGADPNDGFHHCWGRLAEPKPHLFQLHQLYSLKQADNKQKLLADTKITSGQTSMYDVGLDELHGEHSTRQRLQITFTKDQQEWIDPALANAIQRLTWPVIFLDFETCMSAIPWYSGMRPYELMPFQFSAHILREDGSMQHREWLNLRDRNPTLAFIRQLKAAVGEHGSIMVYTDYEYRVLNDARRYLRREISGSEPEQEWISDLLTSNRIVDQHDWVLKWYFHPSMGGRTSIKKVLPAVWQENETLHQHHYFKRYFRREDGKILNPYDALPKAFVGGIPWEVREGCAAMRVYQELILGQGAQSSEIRDVLATLLRQYVTLDTASQWIIFEHWKSRLGRSAGN